MEFGHGNWREKGRDFGTVMNIDNIDNNVRMFAS